MAFRIFIGLIGLLCALLIYDTARLTLVKSALQNAEENLVSGPQSADLIVVELLDYSCITCREVHPVVMRALESDGNIRYIPRPITSVENPNGTKAAQLAYAAGRQGKFMEAHKTLLENFRVVDEAFIDQFAARLQLDPARLRRDMQDPEIQALPEKNMHNLQAIGSQTIPAFLIGDTLLLRMAGTLPTSNDFLSLFNRARSL